MKVFAHLTVVQIVVGLWFLLALEKDVMKLFMGGDILATIIFIVGVLCAMVILWTGYTKKVFPSAALAVVLLYVMSFLRAYVRAGYLKEFFTLDMLKVVPQYSPMILFFVTLVAGLITVVWLLKKTMAVL